MSSTKLPNDGHHNRDNGQKAAKRHTAIIGSVVDMWSKLAWDDGNEDFPSGYTLYHVTSSEMQSLGVAFSQFTSLKDNWWKYLADNELVEEQPKVPEWETNKLTRIFPPLRLQDVKADD
ncbi:MAG: hypothetical protein AXW12_17555 [Thalassospira sp. Nap_22]|nr:MAG: hypothetical protein AXW12_17555 [Thalassospira sp. Nap_22]